MHTIYFKTHAKAVIVKGSENSEWNFLLHKKRKQSLLSPDKIALSLGKDPIH